MPQYKGYKTFDLTVLTTRAEQDKPGTGFNLPYQVSINNLTQVAENGDFHVISLLQKYGGSMISPSIVSVNVAIKSSVFNKFGELVKEAELNNEALRIDFKRNLTKEESGNADVLRKMVMEKILEMSFQFLTDGMNESNISILTRIASLDEVKKKPELQEFDNQIKSLKSALSKDGLAGFKQTASPFIEYWEKMSNYSGEGDANEVKRASLHNLSLYEIASGNYEKAKEYISQYKPIDQQIKAMLGLIKYKNSDELENLINKVNPVVATTDAITNEGKPLMSKEAVVNNYQYHSVNGTITISGKKEGGTYAGTIKINKIPANSFGNIVNLDPENVPVTILTKDASGNAKTIYTVISKIEDLKGDDGSSYISQKYGTPMIGNGVYNVFMKSSFVSPKITVYRAIIPATNDFVVRKAGDNSGVKSSLLNARKNLEEYLNDCAQLAEQYKNGTINNTTAIEKIAEEYSKCK